jgi:hypothetical protein
VKKPYNPVLGEFFRCRYEFQDGSEAAYIAEQVSHHPPISAYHYANPRHGILIDGEARPKSRFLGNSAGTIMCGYSRLTFTKHHNETYEISNPNVYARGVLCKVPFLFVQRFFDLVANSFLYATYDA